MAEQITFLRLPQVMQRTGLSRASIYGLMLEGLFPRPIPIVGRHLAWIESAIDRYNELIVESASHDAISAFVQSLSAKNDPYDKKIPNKKSSSLKRIRMRA